MLPTPVFELLVLVLALVWLWTLLLNNTNNIVSFKEDNDED